MIKENKVTEQQKENLVIETENITTITVKNTTETKTIIEII